MPTTTGMKGDGYYDAHSKEQRAAMAAFLPWLETAMDDLESPADAAAPWMLLDIGSSEGANAIYAMNRLLQRLRRKSTRPIWILFDDLPSNDFNHLFSNLFRNGAPAIEGSDLYTGAIGGSAFDRLVPPQTLHVATSFNALGFLERKPDSPLPNYILPMGPGAMAPRPGVSVTIEEREPFQNQAARDLQRFYHMRSLEMVRGGKLLIQIFGRDSQGSTSDGIYDVLSDAILDCTEQGLLPPAVYQELIFPIYFRSLDELIHPLQTDETLAQAFRVEKSASKEVIAPFNRAFAESGDLAAWADAYSGFLRAFTEAILASVLPRKDSESGDSKCHSPTELLDAIYERVHKRLMADPGRYTFRYVSIGTLLTRI